MNHDKQPLLIDQSHRDDDENGLFYYPILSSPTPRRDTKISENSQPLILSWLVVGAVVITAFCSGIATAMAFNNWSGNQSTTPPYSPANAMIEYERHASHLKPNNSHHSPFTGKPTLEHDEAWAQLTEPVMISASEEELLLSQANPDTAVQVIAGGYLAALGVFHELHCLKRIRQWINKEHYYPNLTDTSYTHHEAHIDHCLETLRISTMCRADISLVTFEWQAPDNPKPAPRSNAERECINWQLLDGWARERAVGYDYQLWRNST